MINIDSRLLSELDSNEMYLLLNLTNRINGDRFCYPGNKLLCTELKWSMVRLQATKRRLVKKGLLEVEKRLRENSPAQTSNYYKILTPLTKNSTPTSKLGRGGISELDRGDTLKLVMAPISNLGTAPTSKLGNEVLTTEVLTIEELTSEVLKKEREKKYLFFEKSIAYKCLIECIYPSLAKFTDYYIGYSDFSEHLQEEIETISDPTTKELLQKIWLTAGKLIQAFKEINRPRPEFRDMKIIRETKKPEARSEAEYQIKAYVDYCRISKTFITTDPEKLPAKLIQCDWVFKLHDLVKDDIQKEKYDPALDKKTLWSQWLVDLYYWQPLYVYECKRYNNRLVYGEEEYLRVKSKAL